MKKSGFAKEITRGQHNPKVSVITGYYNRADCVDLTVLSILDQSYTNIELLVFDDCSTDGTGERLLELQARLNDPRLKIIRHSANKGFTVGMIEAIAQSAGEYICIQGSGDFSAPNRVALQAQVLDSNAQVGVVGCWYTNVVETSGRRRHRKPIADNIGLNELMRANIFSHGEVMMRRATYEAAGGYRREFKFCQDIDLWLRAAKHCKFHTVREFLYERHVRFDGVSYHPEKFPIQARYSIIARRLAQLSGADLEEALSSLAHSGPESLVASDDQGLQRLILRAALRSLIFGAPKEAELLAAKLSKRVVRSPVIAASRALRKTRLMAKPRSG